MERQLEYMRRMVHTAEQGRAEAVKRSTDPPYHHTPVPDLDTDGIKSSLNKVANLEREHLKLTATQSLVEVCNTGYITVNFKKYRAGLSFLTNSSRLIFVIYLTVMTHFGWSMYHWNR
jgi:hypothetical protein